MVALEVVQVVVGALAEEVEEVEEALKVQVLQSRKLG